VVTVRNMTSGDAEDAARVSAASFEDAWDRHEKDYYPRKALEFDRSRMTPESYRKRIQEPNGFAFVVEDAEIVGQASGEVLRGNDVEGGLGLLSLICIHPAHQRRGLGEALLQHVVEHCRQEKCHKITLYCLPVLAPALRLYLKAGFVPEAYLRKEWWGVDFLKMSKWLEAVYP